MDWHVLNGSAGSGYQINEKRGTMKDRMTMHQIIKDSIEEFKERLEDYPNGFYQGEPHDVIHEIADSNVPAYTSDLMELAAGDVSLATNEPELGPAFDGKPTPVNIVAANVYEAIEQALWEYWNEHENEIKASKDEAEESEP